MLDPYTFAEAIQKAVALAMLAGAPLSSSEPALEPVPPVEIAITTQEVVDRSTYNGVITNPFDLEWNDEGSTGSTTAEVEGLTWSLGWIVSPVSGRMVCATAAPCEQDAHYRGAEDSSFNWLTGEEN